MRIHTIDHRRSTSEAYNKTHYLHGRLPERPLCWLLGHKPAVFTYESKHHDDVSWIECRRCRRRPVDLGAPNPSHSHVEGLLDSAREAPWGKRDIDSHAQIVIRKPRPELSLRLHAGGRGSDTPVDAHVSVLGNGLYLGLGFGEKVAELFGGPDRDFKFAIHGGSVYWCLWKDDSQGSRDIPRWRQGSCSINPLDYLFGNKRYSYEDVSTRVVTVTFREGDARDVKFTLQRQSLGRQKLPRFAKKSWCVDWHASKGIPIYVNRDWKGSEVYGSGLSIDDEAAVLPDDGKHYSWVDEAQAKLTEWVSKERMKNGWKPEVAV